MKRAAKRIVRQATHRAGKKIMKTADAMVHGLLGGPKERTNLRKVREIVRAYGEEGAADRLGVKVRTLRSWLNPDRQKRRTPSAKSQGAIRSVHNSPRVRSANAPRRGKGAARLAAMRAHGMRITMTGNIGPHGEDYQRYRKIAMTLPPAEAERFWEAYLDGGPEAAHAVLEDVMGAAYFDQPDWQGSIGGLTDFRIEPLGEH